MTFHNVPVEVALRLRSLPIKFLHPNLRYLTVARLITEHYIGVNLMADARDDPFLRFDNRTPDGRRWEFPARVVQIAQIIFELRNDPGFPEFCRRLGGKRNLMSAFAEATGAAIFKRHGFTIEAKPECNVRTKDFDFAASIPGAFANVEVFALRQEKFRPAALFSRLKDKRKQLPSDAPAVLVCFYPNEWREQIMGLNFSLAGVAKRFFASSDRVNCILFAREEWDEQLPLGGAVSISCFTVPNHSPRHFNRALIDALEGEPDSHTQVEALMASPDSVAHGRGSGEYFDWVDWVIDG